MELNETSLLVQPTLVMILFACFEIGRCVLRCGGWPLWCIMRVLQIVQYCLLEGEEWMHSYSCLLQGRQSTTIQH